MSYEDKYILCYDHGTSGMKTALVSTKGKVVDFTVDEYKLYHPEAGAAEQIPDEWWEALVNTTRRLLKKKNIPLNDIIACTTSNQMDGTIPIDKNGKVLHNCITWMDTRGAEETKRVCGGLLEISGYGWTNLLKWIPKTGGAPGLSGKDIFGHILWLKKEKPSIYKKTYKFLDCKDYLNYRLTGKIGTSYDCGILSWVVNDKDPNNIHYDEKLLKKTNIDVEKLPNLYPATHNLGKLKPEIIKELNLHENCDVIMGAGDIATAAVGSGQVLEGQAHICLGSSSWIVTHIPERKVDILHMVASLPSAIPGKYMALGEQETAGINLTWLRDNLLYHQDELLQEDKVPDVYKIFDKMVSQTKPGEKKIIFTPWMFGERSPVENHTIRAGLYNISLDCNRRHLIRAVFEGVAFNSKWLLKYLEKLIGQKLDPITIIGGGALSDVWMQIYSDILDREVKQLARAKEGNSIGAALIASEALGLTTWEEIPTLINIEKKFKPRKEFREYYDNMFKEFVKIYKNNRKMYSRLNKR